MKSILSKLGVLMMVIGFISCRSTKKIQSGINKTDSVISIPTLTEGDSLNEVAHNYLQQLKENRINFNTFSAKVKIEYEDKNGRQPDANAFIRLQKDSILWVSVSSTFLNIEAFRILITPDKITILNKLEKTVEYHPFGYIEKIARIPLTFSVLQDLLIGNPIYLSDSIVTYRETENNILIGTIGELFKNLLTISSDSKLLQKSKLDDLNDMQNRTADLVYGSYEKSNGINFATFRKISVSEKTKVDIMLTFKQYEFNKELSFSFKIPGSYKIK